MSDPTATIRAAAAARQQLARIEAPRRPRTGRKTAAAIAAIKRLRLEVQLGAPHAALLDRIDDELFKLEK